MDPYAAVCLNIGHWCYRSYYEYSVVCDGQQIEYVLFKRVAWIGVCRIFPGIDVKRDDAPKCSVGDKMGCGIEFRANGKRHLYFTHNSKSVSSHIFAGSASIM